MEGRCSTLWRQAALTSSSPPSAVGRARARRLPGCLETLCVGDNELGSLHGLRALSSLAGLRHLDVAANPLVSAAFLAGIDHRPLVLRAHARTCSRPSTGRPAVWRKGVAEGCGHQPG